MVMPYPYRIDRAYSGCREKYVSSRLAERRSPSQRSQRHAVQFQCVPRQHKPIVYLPRVRSRWWWYELSKKISRAFFAFLERLYTLVLFRTKMSAHLLSTANQGLCWLQIRSAPSFLRSSARLRMISDINPASCLSVNHSLLSQLFILCRRTIIRSKIHFC